MKALVVPMVKVVEVLEVPVEVLVEVLLEVLVEVVVVPLLDMMVVVLMFVVVDVVVVVVVVGIVAVVLVVALLLHHHRFWLMLQMEKAGHKRRWFTDVGPPVNSHFVFSFYAFVMVSISHLQ